MCTDSTTIYSGSSSTEVSLLKPTIFSSVIISTVESNQSRRFAFSFATRSSTPRTSSCSEVITNVLKSIASTDSTTSASVDTLLDSGESSAMSSIASQSQLWSMRKFSACTVA